MVLQAAEQPGDSEITKASHGVKRGIIAMANQQHLLCDFQCIVEMAEVAQLDGPSPRLHPRHLIGARQQNLQPRALEHGQLPLQKVMGLGWTLRDMPEVKDQDCDLRPDADQFGAQLLDPTEIQHALGMDDLDLIEMGGNDVAFHLAAPAP